MSASLKTIRMGNVDLTIDEHLEPLKDSTELFKAQDFGALRQRLDSDGFIFVRGAFKSETVLGARKRILENMRSKGVIDTTHFGLC